MAAPLNLEILSEKTLHQIADPRLLTYCPSMELVAVTSTDQQVLIYRLNGQRVYGAAQRGGLLKVEAIRWNSNGQLLAIAWSDGSVRLVSTESTKIVHQFTTGDQISGITCMGWASNIMRRKRSEANPKMGRESWEDILDGNSVLMDSKAPLNLPRDLTFIDIETSLPKLSVLAAGGNSEDVFCSRSSLDAIFRPFDPRDNDAVDVMVVGTKEGHIHLTIYDSFVIGSFESPVMIGGQPSHLLLHASHEKYSTHALLMKSSSFQESLYFVPMDLRFISASSDYLSLLASRSTALQNLLRYINQVQVLMASEWKATQELPSKFMRNINETLGEIGDLDIVDAFYHSVATGHTFPEVREWLVDELMERGHKRWDKAVTTGLENLRRLVHENMLPALDRCTIILSRFAGIAKFQDTNDTEGFSSHQINQIMEIVACLHLVSSKILVQAVDELELFTAFSGWLRYEIDRLASDASSSANEEAGEKEATIDHGKVIYYLESTMRENPLSIFFDGCAENHQEGWSILQSGSGIFNQVDQELQKQEKGLPYIKEVPQVDFLCKILGLTANTVFSQIAAAEKRNVLFREPFEIGASRNEAPMDMRMCQAGGFLCSSCVVFVPNGPLNRVNVVQAIISIENGISTVQEVISSGMQLGNGQVKDLKFSDNSILLVLWESKGATSLLSIPYNNGRNPSHPKEWCMEYSPHTANAAINLVIFSDEEVISMFSKFSISDDNSFASEKMEIRESKSKPQRPNEDTRRIVFLSKNRLHYKVFKYPAQKSHKVSDEDSSMS